MRTDASSDAPKFDLPCRFAYLMAMPSDLPILYSFRRCPYAMRARLALVSARIPCQLREIILRDKPAHMLEISPKGTVPVLLLGDRTVIEESFEVMLWALEQKDPHGLLEIDRDQLNYWVEHNDQVFKKHLDRYKYPSRFLDNPSEAEAKEFELEHRKAAEDTLAKLEEQLSQHKYLLGEKISAADVALMPFMRQFAHVDKAWFFSAPYPQLQAWLSGGLEHPWFLEIMQKYPRWQPEQEPVIAFGEVP